MSYLNWIGGDISSDKGHNFEHFGHFRIPIPVGSQLAVLDQSLNLCYRFILLVENNARTSKSPPSLNAAVWENETSIGIIFPNCILLNIGQE